MGSHFPRADGPLCPRGATLTESEGDVVLSRPREASSSPGSLSGNLCAEFGKDIDVFLSKSAVASSGLVSFSFNLCAEFERDLVEFGRDIGVNLSKRVEAANGLENMFRTILCVRYLCCGELNAERCRVSVGFGHGGTAVLCGVSFFF